MNPRWWASHAEVPRIRGVRKYSPNSATMMLGVAAIRSIIAMRVRRRRGGAYSEMNRAAASPTGIAMISAIRSEQRHDDAGRRRHQVNHRDEGAAQARRRVLGDEQGGRQPDRDRDDQRDEGDQHSQRQDRGDAELISADVPGRSGEK